MTPLVMKIGNMYRMRNMCQADNCCKNAALIKDFSETAEALLAGSIHTDDVVQLVETKTINRTIGFRLFCGLNLGWFLCTDRLESDSLSRSIFEHYFEEVLPTS